MNVPAASPSAVGDLALGTVWRTDDNKTGSAAGRARVEISVDAVPSKKKSGGTVHRRLPLLSGSTPSNARDADRGLVSSVRQTVSSAKLPTVLGEAAGTFTGNLAVGPLP